MRISRLLCVAALALAGCATRAPTLPQGSSAACAGHGLRIDGAFERGAFAGCRIEAADRAVVTLRPEAVPGNDSAWYALRIRSRRARELTLKLEIEDGTHRYAPKLSRDGAHWSELPARQLSVAEDRHSATLSVQLAAPQLLIAAQPLQTVEQALATIRPALAQAGFSERVIGRSHDGRPITAFVSMPATPRGLVVALARQHPPETTGAEAFDAFALQLAADDPASRALRSEVALLLLPMLNPDGIARGHWRGNARGVDLNRDWVAHAEPETAAAAAQIATLAERLPLLALLDFHSTRRDVIYAAPAGAARTGLGDDFVAALLQRLGVDAPAVARSQVAGSGTAKAWSLDRFGVAGLTYEVADATPLPEARQQARVAAAVLSGVVRSRLSAAVTAPAQASFLYTDWPGPAVPVWHYRPSTASAQAPVVFVMHGVQRDADRYLAEWVGLAETFGFVVVVPEFSRAAFPGAEAYNLGNATDEQGRLRPRAQWSYSVIEGIFDELVRREQLTARGYRLYGHSAGAQFVHRYVLLGAGARLQRAVSANAGWYTFPDRSIAWPYGLAGAPDDGSGLDGALRAPLTLLLGDADIDPGHPSLRRTPEAMQQGAQRFERGQRFYAAAQAAASASGIALGWSCAIGPGLAHDNARAARHAISLLLGDSPAPALPCVALPADAETLSRARSDPSPGR